MDLEFTQESETVRRIYAAWKERGESEPPRQYLGASIVGHECDAYLWLYFRGLFREDFEGRMYRLFDRGRREESVFVGDLKSAGCTVWEFDAEGKQFAVSAVDGHFGGHLDAVAKGVPEAPETVHVCEFKTHSASSFAKLKKSGVKDAKPMHYAQMMCYMGLMRMTRALYLAVNKDTDELYSERIKYSADEFKRIMTRAARIIRDNEMPPRCATRADDWRCKMCAARGVCWNAAGMIFPSKFYDCRVCVHAKPVEGGLWSCDKGKRCIIGKQSECADHAASPSLVRHDMVECADKGAVVYRLGETTFANGTGRKDCFGTAELSRINSEEQIAGAIAAKEASATAEVKGVGTVVYDGGFEGLADWLKRSGIAEMKMLERTQANDGTWTVKYEDADVICNRVTNVGRVVSYLPF